MKNTRVLINKTETLLNKVTGEVEVDATGNEASKVDYNFNILRQHYAGTDFEAEANSLCDIVHNFAVKNNGLQSLTPVVMKVKQLFIGEDGKLSAGFEPYNDFIENMLSILEETSVNKASSDPLIPSLPVENEKPLPNVKSAQAKLLELEQYLSNQNLASRQKWQDYLADARTKAAVGDDSFNPTPEFGQDDMEYIAESTRQKTQRDSAKSSILQNLMGGVQNGQQPQL